MLLFVGLLIFSWFYYFVLFFCLFCSLLLCNNYLLGCNYYLFFRYFFVILFCLIVMLCYYFLFCCYLFWRYQFACFLLLCYFILLLLLSICYLLIFLVINLLLVKIWVKCPIPGLMKIWDRRIMLRKKRCCFDAFNPFPINVSLLYILKTSENHRFSHVFRVYISGTLVENGPTVIFQYFKEVKSFEETPCCGQFEMQSSQSSHGSAWTFFFFWLSDKKLIPNLQVSLLLLILPALIPDEEKKLRQIFFSHLFVVPHKVLWRPLRPS